jgi:hypothetical protein
MIKKHEAGQCLAVFLILILLISNSEFLYTTVLKFCLANILSMLFQTMYMMFSITAWFCFQVTLGTNPISVSAPGRSGDSFVLDMATSAVALGKV